MKPTSQPAKQAQPTQISYGVDSLALFQSYTRDSYRAIFGEEAPPWDPFRRSKTWFDSTVDLSVSGTAVSYSVVTRDDDGRWKLGLMTLPSSEAAAVNLPGAVVYPPYVVQATNATRGGAPVSPLYLSLEGEARALMLELGATGLIDEGVNAFSPVFYPPDEPRRMWALVGSGGQQNNVGGLLRLRNAAGVGAPGHWRNASGSVAWVANPPTATGLDESRPPVEMPVRALFPNEDLRPGVMGFGVLVYRTDLEHKRAEENGAFTQEDRNKLEEIYRIVGKLSM